jgi:hypothetical protein
MEKSVNASQVRQTMQMKRFKYQKMAFESKPVSIHSKFGTMKVSINIALLLSRNHKS